MEKIKYAKFRAVEIVRLVKEGKTVVGHQVISLASPTIEIEVIRNEKPTKLKVAEDVACEMYHEDEPPFPIIRFMTPEVIVGKRMKRISLTECKDDGENDENKGDNDNDGDNGSDNDVANERDDPFEIDYTIIHTAQKQARYFLLLK